MKRMAFISLSSRFHRQKKGETGGRKSVTTNRKKDEKLWGHHQKKEWILLNQISVTDVRFIRNLLPKSEVFAISKILIVDNDW